MHLYTLMTAFEETFTDPFDFHLQLLPQVVIGGKKEEENASVWLICKNIKIHINAVNNHDKPELGAGG